MSENTMWTLVQGVTLINELKDEVESHGYSIGLTGGVLFRSHSSKDLDLVFYPMKDGKDYKNVLKVLKNKLEPSSFVAVKHPEDVKLVFSMKDNKKRRIDLFFPSERFATRTDDLATAGQLNNSSGAVDE